MVPTGGTYAPRRSPQTVVAEAVLEETAESPRICAPERIVMAEFEHPAGMRAIVELPEACREVLVLCDIDGLSYVEIAGHIDIVVGTVRSRLSHAPDWVRRVLLGWQMIGRHE